MNFYTLTYDADLPAVQQVNIPTNSDYKVGMKVKRNGSVQSIKPSEFTITVQDGTVLSADPEKTNGYVTITKASGDEATFKQYGVHIDKGYDFNDVWKTTGQFGSTNTTPPANDTKPSAEELGIVGIAIDGEQFANTAMIINWSNATTPAPANPDDWGNWVSFNINNYIIPYQIGYEGEAAIYLMEASPSYLSAGTVLPDGTVIQEGYNFLRLATGAQSFSQASTTWLMTENSYIYHKPAKFRANYYFGTALKFQFGTPFSADFKLNVNTFKSQQGDIAETVAEMPEVKVDGTYADGTEFSYSFVTK